MVVENTGWLSIFPGIGVLDWVRNLTDRVKQNGPVDWTTLRQARVTERPVSHTHYLEINASIHLHACIHV